MPSGDALKALSDEELKALEGMERANVEARIALLRDVQKLLDAAVTQLNQYSTVMAAIGYVHSLVHNLSVDVNSCVNLFLIMGNHSRMVKGRRLLACTINLEIFMLGSFRMTNFCVENFRRNDPLPR